MEEVKNMPEHVAQASAARMTELISQILDTLFKNEEGADKNFKPLLDQYISEFTDVNDPRKDENRKYFEKDFDWARKIGGFLAKKQYTDAAKMAHDRWKDKEASKLVELTLERLRVESVPDALIQKGDFFDISELGDGLQITSEALKRVQGFLKLINAADGKPYLKETADGKMGKATQDAIINAQIQRNFNVTGKVNQEFYNKITGSN
jgi:hypothetical protein